MAMSEKKDRHICSCNHCKQTFIGALDDMFCSIQCRDDAAGKKVPEQNEPERPFCVTCAHHQDGHFCGLTHKIYKDLVTGEDQETTNHCELERSISAEGRCGPDGYFWKPDGKAITDD